MLTMKQSKQDVPFYNNDQAKETKLQAQKKGRKKKKLHIKRRRDEIIRQEQILH